MNHQKTIARQRRRRQFRVSKTIRGTTDRPRLAVFRTAKHMYAQVIYDSVGKTLAAASTADKELRGSVSYGGNKNAAKAVGQAIAQRAMQAGIKQVCFDRRQFSYHGRVAALADAAREAGLSF